MFRRYNKAINVYNEILGYGAKMIIYNDFNIEEVSDVRPYVYSCLADCYIKKGDTITGKKYINQIYEVISEKELPKHFIRRIEKLKMKTN